MILCNIYKIGPLAEHWSKAYKIQTPWVTQFRSNTPLFPFTEQTHKMHSHRLIDHTMLRAPTCINAPPSLPHPLHLFTDPFRIHYPQRHKKTTLQKPPTLTWDHTHSTNSHEKKSSEAVSEQPNLGQTLQSLPITFARQATTPEIIILDKNARMCYWSFPTFSRVLTLIDRPFHIPFSLFSYNEIRVDLSRLVNFRSKSWGEHRIH